MQGRRRGHDGTETPSELSVNQAPSTASFAQPGVAMDASANDLANGQHQHPYQRLLHHLRDAIRNGAYPPEAQLPTESELIRDFGVGRQTVRRVFQILVAEGLVYRVRGRGTFVQPIERWPLQSLGTAEAVLGEESFVEVLQQPVEISAPKVAERFGESVDELVTLTIRRCRDDRPFVHISLFFPVDVASCFLTSRGLEDLRADPSLTFVGLLARRWPDGVAHVQQKVFPVAVPIEVAAAIDCEPGEPVLRFERLYLDRNWRPIELAIDTFNPRRFTYEFTMTTT
jgi:GntR family transcriptional regulator